VVRPLWCSWLAIAAALSLMPRCGSAAPQQPSLPWSAQHSAFSFPVQPASASHAADRSALHTRIAGGRTDPSIRKTRIQSRRRSKRRQIINDGQPERLPPNFLKKTSTTIRQRFLVDRNVTIRSSSDPWKTSGWNLPLQIFRGGSVPPVLRNENITAASAAASPFVIVTDENNDKSEIMVVDETIKLSHSARSLIQRFASLTAQQQEQLQLKILAEARASRELDASEHLHVLYVDEHICVCNKPSGILSVPGPRRNPSLANLVYETVRPPNIELDQMVVHRLDMDTSGIIVFALTETALRKLHDDFRHRRVRKRYTAILEGRLDRSQEYELDLALERDPHHPPFLRIAQGKKFSTATETADDHDDRPRSQVHRSFQKFLDQAPKPSWTDLRVLGYDTLQVLAAAKSEKELPVTRVELVPHTGRTHQLRVHAAAIGHSIVGDDLYGRSHRGVPLCLHAQQLCFFHPVSGAPMMFECAPSF